VKLIGGASIKLRDIETTDEGWYECSIVFLDGANEHNDVNGTWVYLSVNGNLLYTALMHSRAIWIDEL